MKNVRYFFDVMAWTVALVICLGASVPAMAQKPKWVDNTPQPGNETYKFVEIVSFGNSMEEARKDALNTLAQDQQLAAAAKVSVETGMLTRLEQTRKDGKLQENSYDQMDVKVLIAGEEYRLQAQRVDEYVAQSREHRIQLHTLYMVALADSVNFDTPMLTTHYGALPVAMSVIPGWGQWYKGSKVKGISLFAAEALCVGGIIVCENQRSTYMKKAVEHPREALEYGNRADNWAIGRNICIGVAAGVWVYNLIDAAVSKGARRVVLKNHPDVRMTMHPFVIPDGGAGVSLAFRF